MKKEAVFLSELISKMKRKCNLVELCIRDYLPVAVHLTYFVLRFWILPHPSPRTRKIGQFTSLNWPYKPQYQHVYSPHCLLYIPYGIAGENLLKPHFLHCRDLYVCWGSVNYWENLCDDHRCRVSTFISDVVHYANNPETDSVTHF